MVDNKCLESLPILGHSLHEKCIIKIDLSSHSVLIVSIYTQSTQCIQAKSAWKCWRANVPLLPEWLKRVFGTWK